MPSRVCILCVVSSGPLAWTWMGCFLIVNHVSGCGSLSGTWYVSWKMFGSTGYCVVPLSMMK